MKKSKGFNKRHAPKDSLDYNPTPLWATRALMENALRAEHGKTFLDPCAGSGAMVQALAEYGAAHGIDIVDYENGGAEVIGGDWLAPDWRCPTLTGAPDWIIANPPFNDSLKFIQTAFRRFPSAGLAIMQRIQFLEGNQRHGKLFSVRPPSEIWVFPSRVNTARGKLQRKVASQVCYIWLVWRPGDTAETLFKWLPANVRQSLERDSDYPAEAKEVRHDRPSAQGLFSMETDK